MEWNAKWIKPSTDTGEVVPIFLKKFSLKAPVKTAFLSITALGIYEAMLGDKRISDYVLAPGWTSYHTRLQYQTYDISNLLSVDNTLTVLVGKGWYRSNIEGWNYSSYQQPLIKNPAGLIAQLVITYTDGSVETIITDDSWTYSESPIRFSQLYDGEIYEATTVLDFSNRVEIFDGPTETLLPQQGEKICEHERITPVRIFSTPKGETVVDFGQNLTGYIETHLEHAKTGDILDLSFAEVLDKDGNFYTDNYRTAKCQYRYICKDGEQTYKPHLTFWGFRYIRVNSFPTGFYNVTHNVFTAIAVHSDLKRTGYLSCSEPLLNKLFSNIVWGQKGNFLDLPTDCPQRNERLGWTGDAQVFVKTAALNYDVEKFFTKWLADLAADQRDDGCVGHVIPNVLQNETGSAAWGDAAAICPWQIYLAYGNKEILENQFDSMCKWISYITSTTAKPYLWLGGSHFGDWLGLDAPPDSYCGSTRDDFIASAFYAYSTSLVIKAGKVLGKDVSSYEELYKNIVEAFQEEFPTYHTQTEHVLALCFNLTLEPRKTARQLAQKIRDCGNHLETGFVGTPYLLHALSDNGYTKLAYDLLLRQEYPSWLYSVTKGATTVWEHWDGIKEDGTFWSADMNSFNHYAYGAAADWVYSAAAGIQTIEEAPGYEKVLITPNPDSRIDWLEARLETRHGLITSKWEKQENFWRYDITIPVDGEIVIDGFRREVNAGSYCFFSNIYD